MLRVLARALTTPRFISQYSACLAPPLSYRSDLHSCSQQRVQPGVHGPEFQHYLIKAWNRVPLYEKIPAIVVVIVCFVLGCYVTYTTGKSLFAPTENDAEFPFCSSKFENTIFYNYTAEHEL